ncbi:glycolate oxidase FAD binding subunit [Dichotomicrobium thermohalophilum]|uniref:Glycolate oxidase FAD binding subunit n=2 Tax=Dichotomicrobium thermohalophilum TaxID=933063 RepID=A0A397Q694_9HYPH|nr:glycolate oxidase FAD binding subunit [Dichotomicrobium thermohalophilum]
MLDGFMPGSEDELAAFIAHSAEAQTPVEVCGNGTKRAIGRPVQTAGKIGTGNLTGVTLYEPSELVIAARAGTPLSEVEALLDEHNQMLAFEPADMTPLTGKSDVAEPPTIGSVFATNTSGSRRVLRGAARDHLLGVRAVNGRGETIKWGGRVMKNVTGVDLARGLSGSWGTLAVMTEVTMKVLPKPEDTRTLMLFGLPDEAAIALCCAAMGTPYEVSAAIHIPASMAARLSNQELGGLGRAITALRLENFPESTQARAEKLEQQIGTFGEVYTIGNEPSLEFWRDVRELRFLTGSQFPLWRITTAPSRAVGMVNAIRAQLDCQAAYDWSGGLVWLELAPSRDADATDLRRIIADFEAHATLIRAPLAMRSAVEVFHPLPAANMTLSQKLKAAFDPAGILNPGRMYPEV